MIFFPPLPHIHNARSVPSSWSFSKSGSQSQSQSARGIAFDDSDDDDDEVNSIPIQIVFGFARLAHRFSTFASVFLPPGTAQPFQRSESQLQEIVAIVHRITRQSFVLSGMLQ